MSLLACSVLALIVGNDIRQRGFEANRANADGSAANLTGQDAIAIGAWINLAGLPEHCCLALVLAGYLLRLVPAEQHFDEPPCLYGKNPCRSALRNSLLSATSMPMGAASVIAKALRRAGQHHLARLELCGMGPRPS